MAVHYYKVLLVHMWETETKKEIIKASLHLEIVDVDDVILCDFRIKWFCEALIYKSVSVLR